MGTTLKIVCEWPSFLSDTEPMYEAWPKEERSWQFMRQTMAMETKIAILKGKEKSKISSTARISLPFAVLASSQKTFVDA